MSRRKPSAESNLNNPKLVEFYQTLADVIGIVWEFHKIRLAEGNIPFASMLVPTTDDDPSIHSEKYVPFDPARQIEAEEIRNNYRVVEKFGEGVIQSFSLSWNQFLDQQGHLDDNDIFHTGKPPIRDTRTEWTGPSDEITIPNSVEKFVHPYVGALIEKAQRLGEEVTQEDMRGDLFRVWLDIYLGIKTGGEITSQTRALFGEDYTSQQPVNTAKVGFDHLEDIRRGLGSPKNERNEYVVPTYPLVDDSPLGIKRKVLINFGLGDTIGCPAAMPMSKEAKSFLKTTCNIRVREVMLRELATMSGKEYGHTVGIWYEGLSAEQRTRIIEPETLRVLTGEARRRAIEINCPRPRGERK